jgi:hypothetical protein
VGTGSTFGRHTAEYMDDLDLPGLVEHLGAQTEAGRAALTERLGALATDSATLDARQAELRAIRRRLRDPAMRTQLTAARAVLRETEADITSVATLREDKRHAEYYTQILWDASSAAARLNPITTWTEAMVAFRTLLLPGMSVLMPLLVVIAPVLILQFVLKKPVTFDAYFELLSQSLKKAMPSVLGKPRFMGRGGLLETGEQFVHLAVGAGVFLGGIWNQISAAITMRGVVADMRRRAAAVRRTTEAVVSAADALGVAVTVPTWPAGDLGLFGAAWNQPALVAGLRATMGRIDMLAALGALRQICYPKRGASVALTDLYHPGVAGAARVCNTITMDVSGGRNHVLLTGPNRGGKSTLLKSLGIAVRMNQTLGVVFARRATLPIFREIVTALSPADVVGKLSLFEAEIEFAKAVRSRLTDGSGGPLFLMMDEIFHGTNAHDGVEASQVFLDDLYSVVGDRVFSVVSTHYMDLPRRYGDSAWGVQTLCMEATRDAADPDRLLYTYQLREGVNQLSSVREILRERGLLRPRSLLIRSPAP